MISGQQMLYVGNTEPIVAPTPVHTADLCAGAQMSVDFGEREALRVPIVPARACEESSLAVVCQRLLEVDAEAALAPAGLIVRDDAGWLSRSLSGNDRVVVDTHASMILISE